MGGFPQYKSTLPQSWTREASVQTLGRTLPCLFPPSEGPCSPRLSYTCSCVTQSSVLTGVLPVCLSLDHLPSYKDTGPIALKATVLQMAPVHWPQVPVLGPYCPIVALDFARELLCHSHLLESMCSSPGRLNAPLDTTSLHPLVLPFSGGPMQTLALARRIVVLSFHSGHVLLLQMSCRCQEGTCSRTRSMTSFSSQAWVPACLPGAVTPASQRR